MTNIAQGKRIRIAIVGCGRISRNHFDSVAKHGDDIELAAVCDIEPQVLAEHATKYGVPAYVDMKQREWDDFHRQVGEWERAKYLLAF